jgi:hypothetical protein
VSDLQQRSLLMDSGLVEVYNSAHQVYCISAQSCANLFVLQLDLSVKCTMNAAGQSQGSTEPSLLHEGMYNLYILSRLH